MSYAAIARDEREHGDGDNRHPNLAWAGRHHDAERAGGQAEDQRQNAVAVSPVDRNGGDEDA